MIKKEPEYNCYRISMPNNQKNIEGITTFRDMFRKIEGVESYISITAYPISLVVIFKNVDKIKTDGYLHKFVISNIRKISGSYGVMCMNEDKIVEFRSWM